jgi:hypothetical protein
VNSVDSELDNGLEFAGDVKDGFKELVFMTLLEVS